MHIFFGCLIVSFGAWGSYACTTNVKIHCMYLLNTIFVCKFNNIECTVGQCEKTNKAEVLYSKDRNMFGGWSGPAWNSLAFEGRVLMLGFLSSPFVFAAKHNISYY